MSYVNKSETLQQLQILVQQGLYKKLDYMPDKFNEQQRYAIELFKQRIFLEEIIEESISFNRKLKWGSQNKNLKLTTTAEELVEVFKLRSDIYTDIGYQDTFPDTISGLNFDRYDTTSAIIYYQDDCNITGTIRFIFDSKNKLPSDSEISFDNLRAKYNTIGELSRLMVKNENKALNLEFKYLTQGVYQLFIDNNIDLVVSGLKQDHYKLYSKFGGINILKEMDNYSTLELAAIIVSWNPLEISNFFKKAFLN